GEREVGGVSEHARLLLSDPLEGAKPLPPGPRKLREAAADALHLRRCRLERREVRLREIPVVERVLLGAERGGGLRVLVPVPGFLQELSSVTEGFSLTLLLVADGRVERADRVEVLHLHLHAELLAPARADRDV